MFTITTQLHDQMQAYLVTKRQAYANTVCSSGCINFNWTELDGERSWMPLHLWTIFGLVMNLTLLISFFCQKLQNHK